MPDPTPESRPDPRVVFANDIPYMDGQEDPLKALGDTLAFSVDDWGATRAMSWVWGIVLGWDDASGEPSDPEDDAMAEQAEKHRWDEATVARLRRLHEAFDALSEAQSSHSDVPADLRAAAEAVVRAWDDKWIGCSDMEPSISGLRAALAAPPAGAETSPSDLDVERLARALNRHVENMSYRLHVCVGGVGSCASDIAAEYARLSEASPDRETA